MGEQDSSDAKKRMIIQTKLIMKQFRVKPDLIGSKRSGFILYTNLDL